MIYNDEGAQGIFASPSQRLHFSVLAAPELYKAALAAGDGELDFSAVARVVDAAAKPK
jgi:hypothetical protein